MSLVRVAIDLCQLCLQSNGSRMCETPSCAFWHEVKPAAFVDQILTQSVPVEMDLLIELLDYFEDCADVSDGDYGVPRPNREMQFATSLQAVLGSAEARSKGYDWWGLAKEMMGRSR